MMSTNDRVRTHRHAAGVTWTGNTGTGTSSYQAYGRAFTVRVDGKPALPASADPAFRGDASLHNPEDLFLGAIAGCHLLTYLALCARQGVRVEAYASDATGVVVFEANGAGRFEAVDLTVSVTVAPDSEAATAEALVETAHERCVIASSCAVPIRCHARVRSAATPARADGGAR